MTPFVFRRPAPGKKSVVFALLSGVVNLMPTAYGQSVPRPYKTVHIMMENSTYSAVIGATDPHTGAPYINSLLPISANMTKSVGLFHPTYRNYHCFFSGATQGITSNTDPRDLVGGAQLIKPNLARNLINAGYSFTNYAQGLGDTVSPPFSINAPDGIYIGGENVAMYWIGSAKNQLPDSCLQDLSKLPADYNRLPTVSFWHVVEDHDMHQGYPNEKHTDGDNWIRGVVANYVQWAMKNNSLLILSWDESYSANEDPALYNHIPTLFAGPMVRPGNYSESISHFNMLRTIEDMYGIAHAGAAATSAPITSIWKQSPTETPVVSLDAPVNFDNLEAPANITLRASVVENGHSVSKVQFYNGATLLGESAGAPYTFSWNAVPATSHGYTLYAKAVYDGGLVTSSAPVWAGVWPASQPLSDGLVAYLDFEGNLNAAGGAPTGGSIFPSGRTAHYVAGKLGRAADFMNNGSTTVSASDWAVSLGNLDTVYDGNFTYSFWVKTTSTAGSAIMGNKNWASGANVGWMVGPYPSAKTFNWKANAGNRHDVGVNPRLSDGVWHLVTQTVDRNGNRVVCYYDGKPYNESTVSSNSGSASLSAGYATLIGASGPGTFGSTCSVDDAAVWSRALNPNEVASIYANAQNGKTLLGATPPEVPVIDITTNLEVYLKADGNLAASGGTAVTGAVFSGAPHYTTGKFGRAFAFANNGSTTTGPTDWAVTLGNMESVYAADFSISLWVQTGEPGTKSEAFMGNKNWVSGSNVGWVVSNFNSKNVNWNASGGTRRDVPLANFTNGAWHHVVVTFNRTGNQVLSYIDGTLASAKDISPAGTSSFNAGFATLIGASGPGTLACTGNIDDIAIWSRVLSPSEVSGVYTRGQAGDPLVP